MVPSDDMDWDPALDVTLSDGRQVATFQIAAVGAAGEWWTVVEPWAPHRVVLGSEAALEARQRLDRRLAARLRAGWVPVDAGPILPLSSDLALQIGSLLEALDRARAALRAADPSGRLWAACALFRRQAQRFGVSPPHARLGRAQRERRLGELAERAGDLRAAIVHYRAAVASHPRVGVTRRLTRLVSLEQTAEDA